jgi:pimeloyl-ACP methyl ester carboxylesterase
VPPPIKYARNGDVSIAYQVVGEGPNDVLLIPGWVSHLELDWEEPAWVRWCERLTRFSRLVRFDKRGTGLSDRPPGVATPEERMEDARAVLDAAGVERAHVLGWSEGGGLGILLAATHPERVASLILHGGWAGDDEQSQEELERMLALIESRWGDPDWVREATPNADDRFVRRFAAYQRAGASPSTAAGLMKANAELDVRDLCPLVRVPTLVLHRTGDVVVPIHYGRDAAARIPGARFVELAGDDHSPWSEDPEPFCTEVERFVTGAEPRKREPDAVRAVLHADIEDSTRLAAELGDERFADLLTAYADAAGLSAAAHGGRLVDAVGDAIMACFDGPVAAIKSARDLQAEARALGFRVRAGIHFDEVVERNGHVRGIAVHIAARVMACAAGDEVLVSDSVRNVVAGSGLEFDDRGAHELKGIEGKRRLYAVV